MDKNSNTFKKMVPVQFIIQVYKNKKNKISQAVDKEWNINNVMYRWEHSGWGKEKNDRQNWGGENKMSQVKIGVKYTTWPNRQRRKEKRVEGWRRVGTDEEHHTWIARTWKDRVLEGFLTLVLHTFLFLRVFSSSTKWCNIQNSKMNKMPLSQKYWNIPQWVLTDAAGRLIPEEVLSLKFHHWEVIKNQ